MWRRVLACLGLLVLPTTGNTDPDNSFHHNVDFTTEESGERFKLHSSGVLGNILDVDIVPGIKRLVCVGDRILIVTNDTEVGQDWKVGQLMLGSRRWRCNATQDNTGTGIYVKIASKFFPTDKRISLHVVPAGPYDMIEEANIHFRYTPGREGVPMETKIRHRRYLSNILTRILGNINWHANYSTTIPFNEDEVGVADRKLQLSKSLGEPSLNVSYKDFGDSQDFRLRCQACHGRTDMSYIFELVIKKVNNKPKLLKYISQLEAKSSLTSDLELEITREMGLNYSLPLWESGPHELIRIPVAVVRQLPPVELALSYSTQTLAHVHGYSRSAASVRTGFTATGKYTLSQNFGVSPSMHGDVTAFDWESHGENATQTDVKDTLNVTVAVYQKISFQSSISWKAKDIFIDLSPPMEMTVRPNLKLETSVSGGYGECVESSLRVEGGFSVAKSELTVEAFGINIWDVVLNPSISKHIPLCHTTLTQTCRAHCDASSHLDSSLTEIEVCGHMTRIIARGTPEFDRLEIMHGDEIVFSSEEERSAWCGHPGSPCTPCSSDTSSHVCADRVGTARLVQAITRLSHFVKEEWANGSLVVLEAWDEPTSDFPLGQHGNTSLHYEGRAAVLTISGRPDNASITRLASLCECSGVDFVKVDLERLVVYVAVKIFGDEESTYNSDKSMFLGLLNDKRVNERSVNCSHNAPRLKEGDTVPDWGSVIEVCGPLQGALDRTSKQDMERLYYYDKDGVEFSPEGGAGEVCGHSTRRCRSDCSLQDKLSEPWTWCSTRLMTPRMALKLTQLAKLALVEGIDIKVEKAFDEITKSGFHPYFQEGRALRLSESSRTKTDRLSVLAACSGFDFVNFTDSTHIDVFVKSSSGFLSTRVEFLDDESTRLAVDAPVQDPDEYQYPDELQEEAVHPMLVEGLDSDTYLSEHYTVDDMTCPGRDYFRVDSSLLLCLDLLTDEYDAKVEIIPGSGYRSQSRNMINFDIRHPEEKLRFLTGQAVELRPPGFKGDGDLVELAKEIFRSCTSFIREDMRGIGLGCHNDRLYLDVRPLQVDREMEYITLWTADNNTYCQEVRDFKEELLKGGPVVKPFDKEICAKSPLGERKAYLSFKFNQTGICSTTEQPSFCSATLQDRKDESRKLQERMTSAAGYGRLPRADIHRELDACVVELCGGCPSQGILWDKKVKACSIVVDRFITRATRAFPDLTDRATFFNTEAVESTVHSLACHDGNICIENIQLYSLLMPLVTSRFRPDPTGSIERMMFSSDRNPTPLLELVEQEMAFRASAKVKVFIEEQTDLKDLRGVVKVLMVYNRNVSEVEFHVSDDLDIDLVTADLQRHLDVWAGSTCPERSRFAIAPYSFHELSEGRRKRSLARSVHRNEAQRQVYHWELNWMMKML